LVATDIMLLRVNLDSLLFLILTTWTTTVFCILCAVL
jgi:hypothetical protein